MQTKITILTASIAIAFSADAAKPKATFVPPNAKAIDTLLNSAVSKARFPGAVLWIEKSGQIYHKAYGSRSTVPARLPMELTTAFDAASLTKVVATTPSIMILAERGKLKLSDKVSKHLKEFEGKTRAKITIAHLLTHTSGMPPTIKAEPAWTGYAKAISLAAAFDPGFKPGTKFKYSDVNFILLGEIVRRVSGQTLDQFARKEIFLPLGMNDTGFNPPAKGRARIAPTEKVDGSILQGIVHDPTARRMAGVAGHAGVFTTASDLAKFARMLVNGGTLEGKRILSSKSVSSMTSNHISWRVRGTKRGYGWDINSAFSNPKGEHFGSGSYGHAGWTGTSIWVDPKRKAFVILLSNRVHPHERRSIKDIQWYLGTLAAEAVGAK
jgi:CubicO group peptidase (beta-lactamase class C family)